MEGRGGRGVPYERRRGGKAHEGKGRDGVPLWQRKEDEYEIYAFHLGVCEEDKDTHVPVSRCVKGALNRTYVHSVVKTLHRWRGGERMIPIGANTVYQIMCLIFRRTKCYHLTNCILTILMHAYVISFPCMSHDIITSHDTIM